MFTEIQTPPYMFCVKNSMFVCLSPVQSSDLLSVDVLFYTPRLELVVDPLATSKALFEFVASVTSLRERRYKGVHFNPYWHKCDLPSGKEEAIAACGEVSIPEGIKEFEACPQFYAIMSVAMTGIQPETRSDVATYTTAAGVAIVVYGVYRYAVHRLASGGTQYLLDAAVTQLYNSFDCAMRDKLLSYSRQLGISSWPRLAADCVAAVVALTSGNGTHTTFAAQSYMVLNLPTFSVLRAEHRVLVTGILYALWKSCRGEQCAQAESGLTDEAEAVHASIATDIIGADAKKWNLELKDLSRMCKEMTTVLGTIVVLHKLVGLGHTFYDWYTSALKLRDDIQHEMNEASNTLESGAKVTPAVFIEFCRLDERRKTVCAAHMTGSFIQASLRFATAKSRARTPDLFGKSTPPFNVFLGGAAGCGKSELAVELFRLHANINGKEFDASPYDYIAMNGAEKYPGDVYCGQHYLVMNELSLDLAEVNERAQFLNITEKRINLEASSLGFKGSVFTDFHSIVVTNNILMGTGYVGLTPVLKAAIRRRYGVAAVMSFKKGHKVPVADYAHAEYTLVNDAGDEDKTAVLTHAQFMRVVYDAMLAHKARTTRDDARHRVNANLKKNPVLTPLLDFLKLDNVEDEGDEGLVPREAAATPVRPEVGLVNQALTLFNMNTDYKEIVRSLLALTGLALVGAYATYKYMQPSAPPTLDEAALAAKPETYALNSTKKVVRYRYQGLKSNGVPDNIAESGYVDVTPLQTGILTKLRDNMVTLQVRINGEQVWRTNGVYLGLRRVLTVAHFKLGLPSSGTVEFIVGGVLIGTMSVDEFISMGTVGLDGVDLSAFDGPKTTRTFPKILNLFDNNGFVPSGAMGGYLVNHSVCDTVSLMSLRTALVDANSAGIQYTTNGEFVQTMDSGLVYEYTKGGPGFCGTLALHNNVIVGMHVAGCSGVRGYAVGLSRDDAKYMLNTPLHTDGAAMPNPQHVLRDNLDASQIVEVIENCSLPSAGKEFERVRGPSGPDLVEQFGCVRKVPATVGWHEVDGGVSHKMLDDMIAAGYKSRQTLGSLGGDSTLLSIAIDEVTNWHMEYLKKNITTYEPYNLATSITGCTPDGTKVMEPLDLNKSHGLSSKGPSCVKRSQVVKVDEVGVVSLDPAFEAHYNDVLSLMKRTGSIKGLHVVDRTAKTAPKIELVADKNKLRSFYGSPAVLLYIARQYLGPLVGAWKKDPIGTGTGAGISPSSIHWDTIHKLHKQVCELVLSADVRKWDKCLLEELRECVRVLFKKMAAHYDMCVEDRNVLYALGEYYSGPHLVALAGLIIELRNLWPSGMFGTTQFGSLIHQVAQVYGICMSTGRMTHQQVRVMARHLRESGAIYYSDDSVLPMTEHVLEGWDTKKFQEAMGTLGITLSSATDKLKPPCLIDVSDTSFIARGFEPNSDGTVRGPLDLNSMFSCTTWRHANVVDAEHLASVIPCVYAELIMHGPESFPDSVEKLRRLALHFGLESTIPNYTWETAWTRMRHGGAELTLLCGEPAPVTKTYVVTTPESGILAVPCEEGQRMVAPPLVHNTSEKVGKAMGNVAGGVINTAGKLASGVVKKFVTSAATSALSALGMSKPYTPPSALVGSIGAMAPTAPNATGEFTGTVFSLNPQTLEPSGAKRESALDFLGSRRVMMHKAQWSAIDPSGTVLIDDFAINPGHSNSNIVGDNHQLSLHPAAAAVLSSALYTYDWVTITFTIVSPALMAGSVIASFSGSASLSGTDVMSKDDSFTPTGMLYMDIGTTNEFSITLPWTSIYPMLVPCVSDRTIGYSTNYRAFPLAMSLTVQQPLRNTIVAGTGVVDVYVAFEFTGLRVSNRRAGVLDRIDVVAESGMGQGVMQEGSATRPEVTPTQVIPGMPVPVDVPTRYPGNAIAMRPRGTMVDSSRLSRWTLLQNFTIAGTPGLVGSVSLPGDLLTSAPIRNLLNYTTFLSTKLRLMVQVRSTASQQGLVIASVIPTGLMLGDELPKYVSDFTRATTFQHARVLLGGCREAIIDLDWNGLLPHYQLGGASEALLSIERSMTGYVVAFTLPTPVTNAMGGDATAEVSVYAMMVDAEIAVPNTFTIVQPQSGVVDTTVGIGAGLAPDQDTGEQVDPAVPGALSEVTYDGLYFGGDNVLDVVSYLKSGHYTSIEYENATLTGSYDSTTYTVTVPWVHRPTVGSSAVWNFITSWFSYSRGSMSFSMYYPTKAFSAETRQVATDVVRVASFVPQITPLDVPVIVPTTNIGHDVGMQNGSLELDRMENGCAFYVPEITRVSSVVVPYVFRTAWVYMPPASVAATITGHSWPTRLPGASFTSYEQYAFGIGNTMVHRSSILCFHGCDDYEVSGLRPLIGYGMTTANMALVVATAATATYSK